MNPAHLADLIVVIHLAIVFYVLLGQLLILVGAGLHWGWVRNPWFRLSHLLVIGFVAVQGAGFNKICPLTVWEYELRVKAGQEGRTGSFLGRICHDLLFIDVDQNVLNWIYVGFALVVLSTLWFVRPRRFGSPARQP